MAGFITGNLRDLFPGGIPEGPDMINGGGPVLREITDPTPTIHTTVHPFGEDAMDFPKLGALILAGWLAWKWYERNNRG